MVSGRDAILVVAEVEGDRASEGTLEVLADASEIGGAVLAVVSAEGAEPPPPVVIETLASHGAGRVFVLEGVRNDPEAECGLLAERVRISDPELVLASDTPYSHERMARLAASMHVPLATGCNAVRRGAEGRLEARRPVYGGRFYAVGALESRPALATIRPGAGGRGRADASRRAGVERIESRATDKAPRVEAVRRFSADPREVDIAEADRIVAVGRGLGTPEGMALARRIADRLGAAIAGSRPVVDDGLLPFERQVGQTGKVVSPRLYIALGISGASHHTLGMLGSETIVAVNLDREANIFKIAHLTVCADLRALLPAVEKALAGEGAGKDSEGRNVS